MRTTIGALAVAVCIGMFAPSAAQAQAVEASTGGGSAKATGFLLEGVLSATTTVVSLGAAGLSVGGVAGSLRAGWMFDSFAIALEAIYGSASDDDNFSGTVAFGPVGQIYLWQTADRAGGIYALLGVDFGDNITKRTVGTVEATDDTFVSVLNLGFGGNYFLSPNLSLGLEVGSKTSFVGVDNPVYISAFYAAFAIGFVAG